MSDEKKLTLSGRTLGVGRGSDAGQVRQSFSHGRTKAVVVEHKKKRLLKKGAPNSEGQSAAAETETVAPQVAAPVKAPRPTAKPKPRFEREKLGALTGAELETRMRVLGEAQRRAEDDRVRAEEDARVKALEEIERKKREAAEQAAAAVAAEEAGVAAPSTASHLSDADREAQAQVVKKMSVQAQKKQKEGAKPVLDAAAQARAQREAEEAEAEARRQAAAESQIVLEGRTGHPKKTIDGRKARDLEEEADEAGRGRKKEKKAGVVDPVKAKVQIAKPVKKAAGDDDRRRGRLTLSKALSDDEEGRQRSIAAFRRAQAKKRLAAHGPVSHERQAREITLPEAITVQELANRMAERATEVIKTLMKLGVIATINESLDQDTAELVVAEFGHTSKRVSASDVEIGLFGGHDDDGDLLPRAPVVTVMGHVDHGKTSLLDAIRKTSVVKGEAGGITQHIGAYQVTVGDDKKITFLDTPGHAAFTQMRARGAKVTDIVVLVVAADDGVMPQTIEAIHHARAAGVPVIVAINKMDREGADPQRVRTELLQHEIVVEAMSGEVQDVELSAKSGMGIEALKEAIHLQAELLELKANPNRPAEGVVVEAKLDKGRGTMATVLVQRGRLQVGDIVVAGPEWGKVRALTTDQGLAVKEAGPSVPVEILGLNAAPGAGDEFAVVESEARAREITSYRQDIDRKKRQAAGRPKSLESMFTQLKANQSKTFQIVLKTDVQGSAEAITQAVTAIGNDDISCQVIHSGVGGITETDISLAQASSALVIGFNVRPNKQAREAAERDSVVIKYYSIIYELIDDVKAAMIGELGPEFEETIIGNASIRDVFSAGKVGKAAGCMVLDGVIRRDAKARILRDDVIVYEGQIDNLRRFKDDVKEVRSGMECGMTFENFHDFRAGDILQVYELKEVARTL